MFEPLEIASLKAIKWKKPQVFAVVLLSSSSLSPRSAFPVSVVSYLFLSLTLSSLCVQGKLSHLTLLCLGKLTQSLLIKTLKKHANEQKKFFCLKKC
jgi:hypothetical protein